MERGQKDRKQVVHMEKHDGIQKSILEKQGHNTDVFTIPIHSSVRTGNESRLIFVSDMHLQCFFNVGGYTDAERQQRLMEALIREYKTENSYDAVVFVGDIISNDANINALCDRYGKDHIFSADEEERAMREYRNRYLSQLETAHIPYFCINASHDSLYGENFKNIFGYERNYILRAGTTAYICMDTYGGERVPLGTHGNGQTAAADIPEAFLSAVREYLKDEEIRQAFAVSHWPSAGTVFASLMASEKVLGGIAGHSHYNWIDRANGKPLLQTGHFSRANTKLLTWGHGFKPFVPLNDGIVGTTTDEEGRENHGDYSRTGSPWQWRVAEYVKNGDGAMIESYMVFPEMTYKEFSCDGHLFPAFTQPYTEARPSFLGSDAPVDRSYISFPVK